MTKKMNYTILLLLTMAMCIFTFTDLSISKALYKPGTLFGSTFELIGKLPYFIVGLFSSSFLITSAYIRRKSKIMLLTKQIILLGLLLSVSRHFFVNLNHHAHLNLNSIHIQLLTVSLAILSIFSSALIAKKVDVELVGKWAICGLLLCLSNYIIINLMKENFGRMRFRDMVDSTSQYTRWFIINSNALNDSFRSFPSAHTAGASTIFWLFYLPYIKNLKYEIVLHVIVWTWIILTMMSRVIEGAHFVTDTTMAVIIMYICYLILDQLFWRNHQKISE